MRRTDALLALLAGGFLLLAGFRPDGLPFFNHTARYSDAVVSHWPAASYLRESIVNGRGFPLWRETIMAGQPFAANPLNKTAYPPQWLVLLLPPALHLNVLIVVHLLVGGLGMRRWTEVCGLSGAASLLSAAAFMLSPVMIAHLGAGHLDIVYALAWWPWLMIAVQHIVREYTPVYVLQLALVAALLFLADVRVSLFAFLTAGVYGLIELPVANLRKLALWLVGAIALFILLTASATVPLFVWSPYLSRAGMTPSDAGTLSLQAGNFLGLLLFGVPPGVETLIYVGLPVLVLAIIGLWSWGWRARLIGLAVVIVIALYALGPNGPLWPLLVKIVPALLWFRVPARAWLILALVLPLAAGFGMQRLVAVLKGFESGQPAAGLRRARLITMAFTVIMVMLGLFALLMLQLADSIGIGALVIGGSLGIILLLALVGRLTPKRIAPALIVLTIVDLTWVGVHWVTWRGEEAWLAPHRELAETLVTDQANRVYSPTYSLEQQAAAAYDLRLFGGVDPFQVEGVVQAIEQGGGITSQGYSVVLPPALGVRGDDFSSANQDAVINTQVLAVWNVSHVAAAYPINHARLEYVDTINGVGIYRNRDFVASSQAAILPDWPSGWPNLPDVTTVKNLNDWTATAALVSGVTFLVCLCALLFLYRQYSHRPQPVTGDILQTDNR